MQSDARWAPGARTFVPLADIDLADDEAIDRWVERAWPLIMQGIAPARPARDIDASANASAEAARERPSG